MEREREGEKKEKIIASHETELANQVSGSLHLCMRVDGGVVAAGESPAPPSQSTPYVSLPTNQE